MTREEGPHSDRSDHYCVIGAGTSGLSAAKNLLDVGVPVDVIEREDDIGGNWYYGSPSSSVYSSAHLISSKAFAGFLDFPMPADYPDYPGHAQVLAYLHDYARHFGLHQHIELGRRIVDVRPRTEGGWTATLDGGETRHYRGVVVANGHHHRPRFPQYAGSFHGNEVHSADYRRADRFTGKRVLVVGGGNSGCDLAVDLIPFADRTLLSMRRGYHFWPKFVLGRPIDELHELTHRLRLPLPLRRASARLLLRAFVGRLEDYGLPTPDHRVFESHLVINSRLLYHLRHGDLQVRPDVAELRGDRVLFTDGTEAEIDVIVYATGFEPAFDFLEGAGLSWKDGVPELYLNLFHPERDDLFFVGLVQPDVGIWRLADQQARLMAAFVAAQQGGLGSARELCIRKAGPSPRMSPHSYVASPRHRLEVEHAMYERLLRQHLGRLVRQRRSTTDAVTVAGIPT